MRWMMAVALSCFGGAAQADWVPFFDEAENAYFYDDKSVKREGALRNVTELMAYKKPDGGDRSAKVQTQYDCAGQRRRVLSGSSHTGPRGDGETTFRIDTVSPWSPVSAQAPQKALHALLCK